MATVLPGIAPGADSPGNGRTELKSVLREALERRGVMGQMKARMRAEVFKALDDQSKPKPQLPHENLLINELIRDYLEFNGYKYTCSVLLAESGQPEEPLDREFLAQEMNIACDESSNSVPLLYRMLSHFIGTSREPDQLSRSTTRDTHTHKEPRHSLHSDEGIDATSPPQAPEPLVVRGGK